MINTPSGTDNQPSLRSAVPAGEWPNSKSFECRIFFAIHREDYQAPKRLGRSLCRKCAIVVRQLESDFFTNGWFVWPEAHAWNFVSWGLVNGFDTLRIAQAWRRAVEQTTADVSDRLPRSPAAWLMSQAKRIALELDPRSRNERIRAFYADRSKRALELASPKPADGAGGSNFDRLREEVGSVPKWTPKKHID